MDNSIEYQERPDVILVHTKNVEVLEQAAFLVGSRKFTLISTGGYAFAALGNNVPGVGYLTLVRWRIESLVAVTFCIPNSKSMSIQRVSTEVLTKRFKEEVSLWVTVTSAMRYHVQHPITR